MWDMVYLAVLGLGALIVVHEAAHLAAAKALGVAAEEVSIGFGPAVARFGRGARPGARRRKGQGCGGEEHSPEASASPEAASRTTTYIVRAIPIGGYVKLAGIEEDERRGGDGNPDGDPDAPSAEFSVGPIAESRTFRAQSVGRRALIVAAGPAANVLLAVLLLTGIYLHGLPSTVNALHGVPEDSFAAEAGAEPGDSIVEVEGEPTSSFGEVGAALASQTRDAVYAGALNPEIGPRADAEANAAEANASESSASAGESLAGEVTVVLEGEEGERHSYTGEIPRDALQTMAAREGLSRSDLLALESKSSGASSGASEGGSLADRTLALADGSRTAEAFGLVPQSEVQSAGLFEALAKALASCLAVGVLMAVLVWGLLSGSFAPTEALVGPLGMVSATGDAPTLVSFVFLLAVVSLDLAIFNLLPIPPLDGGHLAFGLIEKLRGRPVSPKAAALATNVGIALMVTLFVIATFADFSKLLHGIPILRGG